jgi:hypothetical protein
LFIYISEIMLTIHSDPVGTTQPVTTYGTNSLRTPYGSYTANRDANGTAISIVKITTAMMADVKKKDMTPMINSEKKDVPPKYGLKKRFWKWFYTKYDPSYCCYDSANEAIEPEMVTLKEWLPYSL